MCGILIILWAVGLFSIWYALQIALIEQETTRYHMSDECYSLLLVIYFFCFFWVCLILCMLKKFLMHLLCHLQHFPAKYMYALHQGTLKVHELLKDDIESVLASLENINFKYWELKAGACYSLNYCMPGKVRLPAPGVVSALLDVGHTFPPGRWDFSWAIAGN